jgi:hypothetical protein
MNGFENFDVRAWLDSCLTRHVSPRRAVEVTVRRRRMAKAIGTLAPVVASAVVAATAIDAAAATLIPAGYEAGPRMLQRSSDSVPGNPSEYWPRAVAYVKSWESVPEVPIDDPPLPF